MFLKDGKANNYTGVEVQWIHGVNMHIYEDGKKVEDFPMKTRNDIVEEKGFQLKSLNQEL